MDTCPFCRRDPFHYVDNGLGMEAVAVTCCELGDLWFRGMRPPIEHDVTITPDEFIELGSRLADAQWQVQRRDRIISRLFDRRSRKVAPAKL